MQIGLSAGKCCWGFKKQQNNSVKFGIFAKKPPWKLTFSPVKKAGPYSHHHCNKALYCMRLEFLTSRAPCVTILRHNPLYRSSDYVSNYIQLFMYIELINAVPWSSTDHLYNLQDVLQYYAVPVNQNFHPFSEYENCSVIEQSSSNIF